MVSFIFSGAGAKFIYVYLLSSLEIFLKETTLQLHLFNDTLRAIDGDENICICPCPYLFAGSDLNNILFS